MDRGLRIGEVVQGEITDDDPGIHTPTLDADYTRAPTVGKTFDIQVDTSGLYHVDLHSYIFDAYLVLLDTKGNVLAEEDRGSVGTHARILFELDAGTRYVIQACALHGWRGPFELRLQQGRPVELGPRESLAAELENAEQGLAHVERAFGPEDPATASSLATLGNLLRYQGKLSQARRHLERALAIHENVFGPDHTETAASLNNLGGVLRIQGHHDRALQYYERALAIMEKVLGPEHRRLVANLNNLAGLLSERGDFERSRSLFERAIGICEKTLGPEHGDTGMCLNNLALLLRGMGEYDEAQQLQARALAIVEKNLGPDHWRTAVSLLNLGQLLRMRGDYEGARPLLERALAINEEALGPEHPRIASCLNELALLLRMLGDRTSPQLLYERALAMNEKLLGPEHPSVTSSLTGLATILEGQGDLERARSLFERALAVHERSRGPDHPGTAEILNEMGNLLQGLGDYDAARQCYTRAIEIREKVLGPEHADTAMSLHNLGILLAALGDDEEARPLCERALAILEKTLGPEHPDTAIFLVNLAGLLESQGDVATAERYCIRALGITERAFGDDHAQVALCLNNLAGLLRNQGKREEARSVILRALEINEEALGRSAPKLAPSLTLLAMLHLAEGDQETARELLERAHAVCAETLGPEHSWTAMSRHILAQLYVDAGDRDAAWKLTTRDRAQRTRHVERLLGTLSEGESYRYLASLLWQLEFRLGLARSPASKVEAYEELLGWKGRIVRLLTASRDRLATEASDEERVLLDELRACQRTLSKLALESAVPDRERHDALLEELRHERNRLELELRSADTSASPTAAISLPQLRASLPPRSAILDLFVHRRYLPARREDSQEENATTGSWSEPRISAWIVRSDDEALVHLDLGPAAAMDEAVAGHLQRGRSIVRGVSVADVAREAQAPVDLRALLWDPIARHLDHIETIFVSPDGVLGTLPFEVLQSEDGRFLIEEHSFVYLQDIWSLATPGASASPAAGSLLSMGAVNYARAETWSPDEATGGPAPSAKTNLRGSLDGAWTQLPHTGQEAATVVAAHEAAFGSDSDRLLLQSAHATEARLKHELQHYRVLHLATHGFFQPEGVPSMWESALSDAGQPELPQSEQARYLVGKHPGLLSGLVCAGVNRPLPIDAGDEAEDGYLTAEEVGWLDLSSAELVVLSACETGLGRARSGEGLIGLRRAFRTAGAKTVISSLWSVGDESTAELMTDFYENLWLEDMGRLEALRAAQLAMLRKNRLENDGDGLPDTWGAFVLSGEWR